MIIYLLVATAMVAVRSAADDDNSIDSSADATLAGISNAIPSFYDIFGSKIAIADNLYNEYEDDNSDKEENAVVNAPSKPCCFPDVWEGRVWSDIGATPLNDRGKQRLSADDDDDKKDKKKKKKKDKKSNGENCGGGVIASRSLSQVYVDGVNKRLAGEMMENHGRPAEVEKSKWNNISYIFLIGANKSADLYLFDRKAEKCRHREMKNVEWTRQCIPPSAASGGQLSLGPAAGGLKVEAWMFEGSTRRADALIATTDDNANTTPRLRPRPRMRLGASVLVLPGSCIPVLIQEEGAVFVGDEDHDGKNDSRFLCLHNVLS